MAGRASTGMGDFNPTADELKAIEKAMKDEKFCKLFQEYAAEISDPKNRKTYEEEIRKMEGQVGNDVKFINPDPGFVVKTVLKSKGTKVFVNICQSDIVDEPSVKTVTQNGKRGNMWSVPNSLTVHRDDVDKSGKICMVYDVVFHPKALRLAAADKQLRKMIIDTALDGIEQRFPVHQLSREDLKFPKMSFKGIPQKSMIRESSGTQEAAANEPSGKSAIEKLMGEFNETIARPGAPAEKHSMPENFAPAPKYSIIHRGKIDMMDYRQSHDSTISTRPKELVVNIELPKCKSAQPVELDIAEQSLSLDCQEVGPYHLSLSLPYPVDQECGSAKFDKSTRTLIVTLPVLPPSFVNMDEITQGTVTKGPIEDVTPIAKDATVVENSTKSQPDESELSSEVPTPPIVVTNDDFSAVDPSSGAAETCSESEWIQVPTSKEIVVTDFLDSMTYHQTDKAISIQFKRASHNVIVLSGIDLEFTEHTFGPLKTHGCTMALHTLSEEDEVESLGNLYFRFDIELEPTSCSVDVTGDIVVVILAKAMATELQRILVGVQAERLTERQFLTTTNVADVAQNTELWNTSSEMNVSVVVENLSADAVDISILSSESSTSPDLSIIPELSTELVAETKVTELHDDQCDTTEYITSDCSSTLSTVQTAQAQLASLDLTAEDSSQGSEQDSHFDASRDTSFPNFSEQHCSGTLLKNDLIDELE